MTTNWIPIKTPQKQRLETIYHSAGSDEHLALFHPPPDNIDLPDWVFGQFRADCVDAMDYDGLFRSCRTWMKEAKEFLVDEHR